MRRHWMFTSHLSTSTKSCPFSPKGDHTSRQTSWPFTYRHDYGLITHSTLPTAMSSRMHRIRVAVWGEAPESPEERRVGFPFACMLMAMKISG